MVNESMQWIKKVRIKVLIGYITVQCVIFILTLTYVMNELYEYDKVIGKRILTNKIAIHIGEAIVRSGMLYPFYIMIFIFTILPTILFYQYYMGTKSIYTMLRLPRTYARLKFYTDQIKTSVQGILGIWILQLLLIILFGGLYLLFVPKQNIPTDTWKNLWEQKEVYEIYPFINPILLLPILSMSVLLPNMSMLLVLCERSRKRCSLAVLGFILSCFAVYCMFSKVLICVGVVPFITLITVGIGIYYIYRIQIV